MQAWPPKDPDEVLDYEFDWGSKRLEAGENILTSVWEVETGSVLPETSPPPAVAGGVTKVWLSGGELGETCIVTNRITTDVVPRVREWSAKLKIKASG